MDIILSIAKAILSLAWNVLLAGLEVIEFFLGLIAPFVDASDPPPRVRQLDHDRMLNPMNHPYHLPSEGSIFYDDEY